MSFEYRVSCSANMVGADWEGEWLSWEGDENMTAEEIKKDVEEKGYNGEDRGPVTRALDEALELAGFGYWVEVRVAS